MYFALLNVACSMSAGEIKTDDFEGKDLKIEVKK
jgi:hypothetical protein